MIGSDSRSHFRSCCGCFAPARRSPGKGCICCDVMCCVLQLLILILWQPQEFRPGWCFPVLGGRRWRAIIGQSISDLTRSVFSGRFSQSSKASFSHLSFLTTKTVKGPDQTQTRSCLLTGQFTLTVSLYGELSTKYLPITDILGLE